MLSQHERRRLDGIERQLQAEDPDLAHRFSQRPPSPKARWATAAAIMAVVISTLAVLLGLLLLSPGLVVVAAAATLASWVWIYRRGKRTRR